MIQAAVLIQPIPDLSQISISRSQEKVFEKGPRLMGPAGRIALEAGLVLQDKSQIEITTLSFAGLEEGKILRESLAMGSKNGTLIVDPWTEKNSSLPVAPSLVAQVLSAALRKLKVSLVFTGPGQVGALVAEELKFRFGSCVETLQWEENRIIVNGQPVALPALLSVSGGFTPRMVNPIKIMKASKIELEKWDLPALGLSPDGMAASVKILRSYLQME